jgi:hypothetical protein
VYASSEEVLPEAIVSGVSLEWGRWSRSVVDIFLNIKDRIELR